RGAEEFVMCPLRPESPQLEEAQRKKRACPGRSSAGLLSFLLRQQGVIVLARHEAGHNPKTRPLARAFSGYPQPPQAERVRREGLSAVPAHAKRRGKRDEAPHVARAAAN